MVGVREDDWGNTLGGAVSVMKHCFVGTASPEKVSFVFCGIFSSLFSFSLAVGFN